MKPIAIFRHSPGEGPGYFATFLDRHSLPSTLFRVDDGVSPPPTSGEFSGLCFMGGPMSVNDSIYRGYRRPLQLIREADDKRQFPVIGHCLGGQLMARALGGTVTRNPVKEIGWGDGGSHPGCRSVGLAGRHLTLRGLPLARRDLLHPARRHPHPAKRPLRQPGLRPRPAPGPAMPCRDDRLHDPPLVPAMGRGRRAGIGLGADAGTDGRKHRKARIAAMRAVADRLYTRWIDGLDRS
jgi:hypothetical protein